MGRHKQRTTAWSVRDIEKLTGRRTRYYNRQHPSLSVLVELSGRKFFQTYYRLADGRKGHTTVGEFPTMLPGAAIVAAQEMQEKIRKGFDPTQKERRAKPTVDEYWRDEYWKRYVLAKPTKKGRGLSAATQRNYASLYRHYISPALGKIKLHDLTRSHVKRLHQRVTEQGKARTANFIVAVLRSFISFAVDREVLDSNFLLRLRLNEERKRQRTLTEAEKIRLREAAAKYTATTGDSLAEDAVLLGMLTGQRRSNILGVRWEDLRLAEGLWAVRGATTKNGEPHIVVLLPEAVAALLRRHKAAGEPENGYVFEGKRTTVESRFRNGWNWCRDEAKVNDPDNGIDEDICFHTLRHNVGTELCEAGVPDAIVGAQLGHRSPQSTARYVHARLAHQQRMILEKMSGAGGA